MNSAEYHNLLTLPGYYGASYDEIRGLLEAKPSLGGRTAALYQFFSALGLDVTQPIKGRTIPRSGEVRISSSARWSVSNAGVL
jgi:hypothetical protein